MARVAAMRRALLRMRALLLLLLSGCTTLPTAPCSTTAQPGTRFACSQLPNCKYNCALTIVVTDGGTAPQTVTQSPTQTRSGLQLGAPKANP